MRRAPAVLAFAALAWACSAGDSSVLDSGPRVPDASGVVVEVTNERIRLEGGAAMRISSDVESFTTRGHEVTPLLAWNDKYVHVGLRDEEVVWVAGIGVVLRAEGRDPEVLYTGEFEELDDGRAVFRDGTTLQLAPGTDAPEAGTELLCTIDPETGLVTRIVPA